MATTRRNIDTYIEHKIQKELDKTLSHMLDRRLRQLNLSAISKRHQSNTVRDFTHGAIGAGLKQLQGFGNSGSQFMGMFLDEVRRGVVRGL